MGHCFKTRNTLLFAISVSAVLGLIKCEAYKTFLCPKKVEDLLPAFPPAYSTDIRLNFVSKLKTVELRHYWDAVGKRESLEIFAQDRHVKYIIHDKQHLLITFPKNDFPTCSVKSSKTIQLEDEDSGPNGILQKIMDASANPTQFYSAPSDVNNGIYLRKWEGCFKDPLVNVSFGFSEVDWKNPGNGTKNKRVFANMEAQIDSDFLVGLVDNFQSSMPEDIYFQPPPDVYCAGFREDKKPPEISNYFSHDEEFFIFSRFDEIIPIVTQRTVYFDNPSKLTRLDFYDTRRSEIDDVESKLVANSISIIHDFNAKIQYTFDLPSFKCEAEEFLVTDYIVDEIETKDSPMLTGKEYFSLNLDKISYNGQFVTRGYLADVFTALVPNRDAPEKKFVYTWYFSSTKTQIAEEGILETSVPLRMIIHPESGSGTSSRLEINIINYKSNEPSGHVFDITNCYNETALKLYVITFPANNDLKGSENFLKLAVHLALKDVTGISKQRIFVTEVAFSKQYMYAEFKLLDSPSVLTSKAKKELSMNDAVSKIKAAVSAGSLKVSVSNSESKLVILTPLKDGFNEFAGDRRVQDPNSYGQGSVIGLTIGMLLLGFVVGGIVLNLVVSRKFGVSLFQSKKGGMDNFNNPLSDSKI